MSGKKQSTQKRKYQNVVHTNVRAGAGRNVPGGKGAPEREPSAGGGRFSAWRERELAKLRPLSRKEKAGYILDYYWLWIFGIAAAVILAVYIIYHAFFTVKDFWFYGVFANTSQSAGNQSELWKDFKEYSGFDTKEKKIEMNAAAWFDPSVQGGTNNSYFQSYVALTESGDLDVVTMGTEGILELGRTGRLADLGSGEMKEIFEKYEDRLLYSRPYDEEYSKEEVPIGIDISDSLLVTKYHVYEGDCALGISAYTERPESAELFLEFLFDGAEEDRNAEEKE